MTNMANALKWHKMTYASMFVLCLMLFVSVSATALSHILVMLPAIYFLNEAIRRKELNISLSMWSIVVMVIISVVSVIFSDGPIKNIFKLKYFTIGVLSVWAFRATIRDYMTVKRVRLLINVLLIASSVATISGLIGYWSGFNPLRFKAACHETRACGMYGMYMTYGYGIGFLMMLVTGVLIYAKDLKQFVNYRLLTSAFAINLVGLILAKARGSILAFLICFPLFFLKKSKKLVLIIYGLVLVGSIVLGTTSTKVQQMFGSFERIQSVEVRLSHYQAALRAFEENPWLGIGFRNFEAHSLELKNKYGIKHAGWAGHAHNNYLQHFATTGVVGGIALLMFHLLWFIEVYRRRDVVGYIFIPFIMYLILTGLVQYTLGDGENMFLIMFIYALSQSIPVRGVSDENSIS